MRTILALSTCLFVSCGGGNNKAEFDPVTLAFRELKKARGKDSFLIIRNDGNQQYIQFKFTKGAVFFNRPILAASKPELPVVSARFYRPVEDLPMIEGAGIYRFLSPAESDRMEKYLDEWNLATDVSYRATEDDKGDVVEYFENFDGLFTVPEWRISEFLEGYFSAVFNVTPEQQNLQIEKRDA